MIILHFNELISFIDSENIYDTNGMLFFEYNDPLTNDKIRSNLSYAVDLL